jgi:hypothetical protein
MIERIERIALMKLINVILKLSKSFIIGFFGIVGGVLPLNTFNLFF